MSTFSEEICWGWGEGEEGREGEVGWGISKEDLKVVCTSISYQKHWQKVYNVTSLILCSNGALYEWDIATGTCVRTLISHSKAINFVYVSICSVTVVCVLSTGSSEVMVRYCITIQAKDHKIITAAEDYTVCVWYMKKSFITVSTEPHSHVTTYSTS